MRPARAQSVAWVGRHAAEIRADRAAEEAAMAQMPAEVVRRVHLRFDSDGDLVYEFESGERRYALVVVLGDRERLGWKECQALADCMKVAARGTKIGNESFMELVGKLKQKYGTVRGPAVESRRLVALVKPGPGELRCKDAEVLGGVSVSFDDDGDFGVTGLAFNGRTYNVTICLPTGGGQCFGNEDCNAFIQVMQMLETGDRMDSVTYVSYLGVLRSRFNFVQFGRNGDQFSANLLASRVKNVEPIESVILQALAVKQAEIKAAEGAAVLHCPYPNMTYTRALQESGQAQVYAGETADGKKVAIKVFKGDAASAAETYRTELRMLLKMPEHRYVIEVLEFFENPQPALVTRLVEGEGDMMSYIQKQGRFEEREGRRIAAELAEGICHLHRCGIVHRDLKTPNVLLQKSASGRLHPIVIDLGLGSTLSKKKASVTMTMQELVASMAQTGISSKTDGAKGTYCAIEEAMCVLCVVMHVLYYIF
jgi:tRNA A-37 threonylcarbamoyl transferase component Bud32